MNWFNIKRGLGMAFAAFLFSFSFTAYAMQGTAEPFQAASQALLEKGDKAFNAQDFSNALTIYETALVANPGNVDAFIAIGQTHEALGDRGLGIDYYQRALKLKPDSQRALAAESLAFLADHGLVKAEENLAKLRRLCRKNVCPEVDRVSRAIEAYKREDTSALSVDEPKN